MAMGRQRVSAPAGQASMGRAQEALITWAVSFKLVRHVLVTVMRLGRDMTLELEQWADMHEPGAAWALRE